MDQSATSPVECVTAKQRLLGAGALTLLLAWQAWLTLGLFGDYPWSGLTNDEMIISGANPQHQFLGAIGAQAFKNSGCPCAYVTSFQAGILKTPIFNGSRFAEVFFYLGGGTFRPAAYKMGIAAICLLGPLLLFIAARGTGLNRAAALLAGAMGVLVWWGPHSRAALETGEFDLHLASLAILAHIGMLLRFDREPGILVWLGMVLTAALGWFAQPLLVPIGLPLLLLYYLCTGVRHCRWSWHLALLAAEVAALAIHVPWLIDWLSYWWLRLPLPDACDLLPHRTLQTVWNAPLWGGPTERALAMTLLGSATLGISILYASRRRPAARLFFLGTTGLVTLALLGIAWQPLGQLGTAALLAPALWFACVPAAFAWTWLLGRLSATTAGAVAVLTALGGLTIGGWFVRDMIAPIYTRAVVTEPLQLGLGPERESVVAKLNEIPYSDARILWEDRPLPRATPHWSALLPLLTKRSYLGGLDPDGFIEPSSISFLDQLLAGRPISSWTDNQLDAYCRRYNIGWVVCWTPAAVKRFSEWDGVESHVPLVDDVAGKLFTLKRQRRTYALKGQATLLHADAQHITLGDVIPDENGVVVLSFHWQSGLRAAPGRVQVEREPDGHDPIGFIRLRMDSPAARVTLTWEHR